MKTETLSDLQMQYTTYKNTLQQLAQKIGDVEQEKEEHKYVSLGSPISVITLATQS